MFESNRGVDVKAAYPPDIDDELLDDDIENIDLRDGTILTSHRSIDLGDVEWMGLNTEVRRTRSDSNPKQRIRYWEIQLIESAPDSEDEWGLFDDVGAEIVDWKHVLARSRDAESIMRLFDCLARRCDVTLEIAESLDEQRRSSRDYCRGWFARLDESSERPQMPEDIVDVRRSREHTILNWRVSRWDIAGYGGLVALPFWGIPLLLALDEHHLSYREAVFRPPTYIGWGLGALTLLVTWLAWHRSDHGDHRLELDDDVRYIAPHQTTRGGELDRLGAVVTVDRPRCRAYLLMEREIVSCSLQSVEPFERALRYVRYRDGE